MSLFRCCLDIVEDEDSLPAQSPRGLETSLNSAAIWHIFRAKNAEDSKLDETSDVLFLNGGEIFVD